MNSVDEIEYLVIPRPALATEYLCSSSNSKMTYYFLMEQQASILTFPDGLIPKILSGNISNAFSEVEWTKFPRKTYEHFLNWYLSAMLDCRQVAFSICEEVSCTPNLLSKSSPLTFVSCQDQTLQRDYRVYHPYKQRGEIVLSPATQIQVGHAFCKNGGNDRGHAN